MDPTTPMERPDFIRAQIAKHLLDMLISHVRMAEKPGTRPNHLVNAGHGDLLKNSYTLVDYRVLRWVGAGTLWRGEVVLDELTAHRNA